MHCEVNSDGANEKVQNWGWDPSGLSQLQLSPNTMAWCPDRLFRINLLRKITVASAYQDYPASIHGSSRPNLKQK